MGANLPDAGGLRTDTIHARILIDTQGHILYSPCAKKAF